MSLLQSLNKIRISGYLNISMKVRLFQGLLCVTAAGLSETCLGTSATNCSVNMPLVWKMLYAKNFKEKGVFNKTKANKTSGQQ